MQRSRFSSLVLLTERTSTLWAVYSYFYDCEKESLIFYVVFKDIKLRYKTGCVQRKSFKFQEQFKLLYEIKEANQKRHLLLSYEALLQGLQVETPIELCF